MNRSVTQEDVKKLAAMSHYERLGVDKSGDSVAIKRAYRIASMRYVVYPTIRVHGHNLLFVWRGPGGAAWEEVLGHLRALEQFSCCTGGIRLVRQLDRLGIYGTNIVQRYRIEVWTTENALHCPPTPAHSHTAHTHTLSRSVCLCLCLCHRYHPDKAREEDRVRATECFQMVNVAHAVLGDPMKRQA